MYFFSSMTNDFFSIMKICWSNWWECINWFAIQWFLVQRTTFRTSRKSQDRNNLLQVIDNYPLQQLIYFSWLLRTWVTGNNVKWCNLQNHFQNHWNLPVYPFAHIKLQLYIDIRWVTLHELRKTGREYCFEEKYEELNVPSLSIDEVYSAANRDIHNCSVVRKIAKSIYYNLKKNENIQ